MAFEIRWVVPLGCWLVFALVAGCGELASPPEASQGPSQPEPVLTFEPPLMGGRVAPVVQLWISDLPEGVEPMPMVLEGIATERNMRDLAKGSMSTTLESRIVAASVMTGECGSRVIAPHSPLALGEKYSVVGPALGWSSTFEVIDRDEELVMKRVWPPAQTGGSLFVWCLELPSSGRVETSPQPWRLAPGVDGTLEFGALAGIGRSCVRWIPATISATQLVPPTRLPMADGRWARIDPLPLSLGAAEHGPMPDCDHAHASTGPACAAVQDDRATLATEEPWLVALEVDDQLQLNVVAPDAPWMVRSLKPATLVEGVVHAASGSGAERRDEFFWTTLEPLERVVINEVLANPVGPEPQQEWVELYNDGSVDVLLAGWVLEDAGGGVELPGVALPVGRYGLVVGEGYDPNSWVDAAPSLEAIMLRVVSVGTAGLSNAGEPIRLRGRDGTTVSRIPAIASKRQGWSIVRLRPEAADDVMSSFGFDAKGGTPGAQNRPGTEP